MTVWLACMEMPISAIVAGLGVAVAGLWWWRGCLARVIQGGALVALLAVVAGGFWVPLHEGDATLRRWQTALDRGESLRTHQLVGAYGLHALLIPIGFVAGFPEASWEVVALHLGGDAREWDSDVVLHEPAARAVVRGWVRDAEAGATGQRTWRYAWNGLYNRPEHSLRAALALNCPLVLTGQPGVDGGGSYVDLRATCLVKWPRKARIPVGRVMGRSVALEEGVWAGLQDAGWIAPVEVAWTTRVRPDDPQLQGEDPRHGWVEAALVRR